MSKLVFVDTGILIAAARGDGAIAERAMQVLDDPDVRFASSNLVKLEVLPKPQYNRKQDEVAFYQEFFAAVAVWAEANENLVQSAFDEAVKSGLDALDSLHVASAVAVGADELVTTEKQTKPLHRSKLVSVRTITPAESS